jgi:hypothetical protein
MSDGNQKLLILLKTVFVFGHRILLVYIMHVNGAAT